MLTLFTFSLFEVKLGSSQSSESEWLLGLCDEIGRGDGLSEYDVIEKQPPDAFSIFGSRRRRSRQGSITRRQNSKLLICHQKGYIHDMTFYSSTCCFSLNSFLFSDGNRRDKKNRFLYSDASKRERERERES